LQSKFRWWLLAPLIVFLLACQAIGKILELPGGPTPIPTSTSGQLRLPSETTAIPASLPSATLTLSVTQKAPTHESTLTLTDSPSLPSIPSPEADELSRAVQLSIFDYLWNTVNEEYLYPDFNGLDWNGIYYEYQDQIKAGLTGEEFYQSVQDLVYRLGDDHSVFLTPGEVQKEDAEYEGNYDYIGVGIYVAAVPDRQRAVILGVFPNSPAERAGLQPRDNILSVDGQPILDEFGVLQDIIRGPEGTRVTLMIETPGQTSRELLLSRERITTALPIPHTIFTTSSGTYRVYFHHDFCR
jgi:carboxyl-terminal processing protease